MHRIIVINTHKFMPADQLTKLRKHVESQLPAEGFVVIVLPEDVTAQEIGLAAERVDNVDAADLAPATTTSPSGKTVEHVDGPAEDEPIRFVWLGAAVCTEDQRLMALGERGQGAAAEFAVAVDQCLPLQLDGREVQTLGGA